MKKWFCGQGAFREGDGAFQLCVIRLPFPLPTVVPNCTMGSGDLKAMGGSGKTTVRS